MEIFIKSCPTAQLAFVKVAALVEGQGGNLTVIAEIMNTTDSDLEGVAVKVANAIHPGGAIDETEVDIGFLAPLARQTLTFKLPQRSEDTVLIDLIARHRGARPSGQ